MRKDGERNEDARSVMEKEIENKQYTSAQAVTLGFAQHLASKIFTVFESDNGSPCRK